jgi:hypothetical protein
MALVAKAEAKSEAEAKLTCHCALADAIDGSMLGPGTWPSAITLCGNLNYRVTGFPLSHRYTNDIFQHGQTLANRTKPGLSFQL